ncbi:MAG: TIGR02391 family protein [Brachymonas sp.]|nr:TIGR02391 family protein [Brachymonas sp.]
MGTSSNNVDGTALADLFSFAYDRTTGAVTRSPKLPINNLSTESFRNIQDGQQFLTRGLMAGFRNPINYAPISKIVPNIFTELDCLNILSLVSYLSKN